MSTTVCFMRLKANKLYGLYKRQFLRFAFVFTIIFFIKLRNVYETFRTKVCPEMKKFLTLGLVKHAYMILEIGVCNFTLTSKCSGDQYDT